MPKHSEAGQSRGRQLVMPIVFLVLLGGIFTIMAGLKAVGGVSQSSTPSDILQPFATDTSVPPSRAYANDKKEQPIDLPSALPKTGLVTFWSSECSECQVGLPDQQTFHTSHPELPITLINVRDSQASAEQELKSLSVTLPTYYDLDGSASIAWSATMPASYFIKDGQIRYFFTGRISTDHLNALLNYL